MLKDKIKFRKIRYDVLEYLDQVSYINRIDDYIANKELYEGNSSHAESLLREARLDTSNLDYDVVAKILSDYKNELMSIDSINKATMMEYINNVVKATGIPNAEEEYNLAYDELENFLLQFLQIQTLQSQMINSVTNVLYMGDDNCLHDIKDDSIVINVTQYASGLNVEEIENYDELAINYIADKIIGRQRALFTSFDYDDDGYYLTGDGEEVFVEDVRKELLHRADEILTQLLDVDDQGVINSQINDIYNDGTADASFGNSSNRKIGRAAWEESKKKFSSNNRTKNRFVDDNDEDEEQLDNLEKSDIIDDVSETYNNESKTRLNNLKKSLGEHSVKINKR